MIRQACKLCGKVKRYQKKIANRVCHQCKSKPKK